MSKINEQNKQRIKELGLDSFLSEKLLSVLWLREYEKGDLLTVAGDEPSELQIMLKGKVRVVPLSEEGQETILTYLDPPDMLGDIELLNNISYLHTTEAVTGVSALVIPSELFRKQLMNEVPFLQYMLKAVTGKLVDISDDSSNTRLYGLRSRLCRYIYRQRELTGRDTVPFSTKQVAPYIGVSERHLRRLLADLQDEGLIEKMPRKVKICDPAALQKEAAGYR